MAYQPSIQSYGNNTGMHYEGGFGGFGGKWVPNTNFASRVGASGGIGGFWDTGALPPIQQGTVGTTPPAWQATGGGTQYAPGATPGIQLPGSISPTTPSSYAMPGAASAYGGLQMAPTTPGTPIPYTGPGYLQPQTVTPTSTQPTLPPGIPAGSVYVPGPMSMDAYRAPDGTIYSTRYGQNGWTTTPGAQAGTTAPSASAAPNSPSSTPSGYLTNFQYGSNPLAQSPNTSNQTNPFMDFAMGGNTKFPGLFSSQGSDWSSNIPTSLYSNTIGSYA